MTDLTKQQRAIRDFIERETAAGRPCPSQREIAGRFGFASKTAVACHVRALVKKGVLAVEAGKARSLRLVNLASASRRTVVEVPLFGTIPAGFGADREQETAECVPVTIDSIGFKPTRNTFALRVSGDSMIGKHICDGDIVVLEHGPDPRPGQIVAALIDGQSTLKTFILKNGKPYLRAENPNYPDLIPAQELMIQGVFKALIRKAKAE
jgi:repressor LexA